MEEVQMSDSEIAKGVLLIIPGISRTELTR